MAALITTNFVLPQEYSDGVFKKAQDTSVLAKLCAARPQKFGKTNVMVLTSAPKAELVGEGAEKSPTPTTYSNKTVVPLKVQCTVRVTNEVMWADEDYQRGIMADIQDNCGIALGRALDLMGIHKINPLTGAVASSITEGICDTANTVTVSNGKYDEAIEGAAGLVIADHYTPDMVALDPVASFGLATMRDANGRKLYPEMGLGLGVSNFDGLKCAIGDTVSAGQEIAVADNIVGVVGKADAFRWGVQREIAAHVIEFGDPDGLGDLQRLNQVAIRAEMVVGVGIMDTNAFAVVKSA